MVLSLTGLLTKIYDYHIDYWHVFGKSLKNKHKIIYCSRQRVLTLKYLYEEKASPEQQDFECEQIPVSE